MTERHVSPRYPKEKLDEPSVEDEIDVFEDQFKGWLFTFARQIADSEHSGFAVLALTVSYFEAIVELRVFVFRFPDAVVLKRG